MSDRTNTLASDHSPAPASMKAGEDAFRIRGGIGGVRSTLPAAPAPGLPPAGAASLTAANAAERLGIARKGGLKAGYDAGLRLVDAAATHELTRERFLDRHKLSSYVGRTFGGLVRRTIVRGHNGFRDGRIVAGDFRGRPVTPVRREGAGRA